MKKILLILLGFILFSCGCGSDTGSVSEKEQNDSVVDTKKVETFYDENKTFPDEIYYVYDDTIKHGEYIHFYYKDTIKEIEGKYINNIMDGEWKSYHENGLLSVVGKIIDGVRNGEWLIYDDKSNIIEKIIYENRDHAKSTGYYDNGIIKNILTFKPSETNLEYSDITGYKQVRHEEKVFNKSGKLISHFRNDELIEYDVITYGSYYDKECGWKFIFKTEGDKFLYVYSNIFGEVPKPYNYEKIYGLRLILNIEKIDNPLFPNESDHYTIDFSKEQPLYWGFTFNSENLQVYSPDGKIHDHITFVETKYRDIKKKDVGGMCTYCSMGRYVNGYCNNCGTVSPSKEREVKEKYSQTCPACYGSGKQGIGVNKSFCTTCNGTGKIYR